MFRFKYIIIFIFLFFGIIFLKNPSNIFLSSDDKKTSTLDKVYDSPVFGLDSAKTKIIYYYDYQCKWCKKFELNTFPKLKKYITNGSVQITFKDYVFLGRDSTKAALWAECIYREYDKFKFLEFHAKLYQNQKLKNTGWVTDSLLKDITMELNIDFEKMNRCVTEQKYLPALEFDTNEGRLNYITSTPSFIINSQRISGFLPIKFFEAIIEKSK